MTIDPERNDLRKLLFISYAYEDEVLAKWLARKLAIYGYGVWIDQIKILGGESWVEEVDVAIKERSFRVLALLSKNSIAKPNPRKERTLALQLGKQRGLTDFLITLNQDGVDPDWTLSDISWISFRESWADGLRRLLKKLESIGTPRIHDGNPGIAKATLDRGMKFVIQKPEELITNWISFTALPEKLKIFDTRRLSKEEERAWPSYGIGKGLAIGFEAPSEELAARCKPTGEEYHWPSVENLRGSSTINIVAQILNRTVRQRFEEGGSVMTGASMGYLPDPFKGEAIYRFIDADGTRVYIRTSGIVNIKRLGAPPETIIYHPSIRFSAKCIGESKFVLQLQPGIMVFDKDHQSFPSAKIGPRRKKVTRGWYNQKWRRRLIAFASILHGTQTDGSLIKLGELVRLSADQSLDERQFSNADEVVGDEEPAVSNVVVDPDELEAWNE